MSRERRDSLHENVAQCVVFFVDGEDGGIGHLRVLGMGYSGDRRQEC